MSEKKALSMDELEDVSGGYLESSVHDTSSTVITKPNLNDLELTNVIGPKKLPPGIML